MIYAVAPAHTACAREHRPLHFSLSRESARALHTLCACQCRGCSSDCEVREFDVHQESRDCWKKWQGVRCQLSRRRGPVRVITLVCRSWPVPPDAAGATPSCRRSEEREEASARRPRKLLLLLLLLLLLQILTSRRCSSLSLLRSLSICRLSVCSLRLIGTMSAENAQTLDNTTYMHEEYALLQDLEEYQQDILGGLSVLVNDNNLDNTQVQELVLNDEVLNSLTAVTLPDGTQAFVTQNNNTEEVENEESQNEEATLRLDNGAIVLGDLAELNNEKVIQVQLDQLGNELAKNENIVLSDGINVYPHLQIVNGTLYLVTDQLENCQEVCEGSDEEPKNDAIFSTDNQNEEDMSISEHQCPEENCTKPFSTNHLLKIHDRSHTNQRPYMCTQPRCKKSFSTSYSLKSHLRTHTGEKPYKCTSEDCDKSFKTSGDLLKHVRTHTGERPFVCPFNGCGRSFTTSNIRKVHIRTHTGERPFKCPQPKCGKAFASSTNYKNHIRIHSGEKPYVCTIKNCGKRFTEYSSLYKHHIVHTQEKPYECDICHRQYRQHSTLLLHKKTTHLIVGNENDNDNDNENDKENDQQNIHDDDDDVLDVLLENSVDMIENSVHRMNQVTQLAYVNSNSQIEVSPCITDGETQILVVEDPSQLITLQATLESLNEGPDNPIDITLDDLNMKYENVELRWN